jgi:hypothetical protein
MIHHVPLRPPLHDFPADEWNIIEKGFHPEFLAQLETIMALGNGYLGMRGCPEGCHPCLRYVLLPMSPVRTADSLLEGAGFEPSVPPTPDVFADAGSRSRRPYLRISEESVDGSHRRPERFWSNPQADKVVLRVAQPAGRAGRK